MVLEEQPNKIASSEADTDSSGDKTVFINAHASDSIITKPLLDSLISSSSVGVKVNLNRHESIQIALVRKRLNLELNRVSPPTTAVLSYVNFNQIIADSFRDICKTMSVYNDIRKVAAIIADSFRDICKTISVYNDIRKVAASINAAAKESFKPVMLYRTVTQNETCRMMTSIDMVVSEAMHLFGLERTRIFFDLLHGELFHFGSAGAISNFVPNMTESDVRQHVTSFFEHACDTMNRLMILFGYPDSKELQQMPQQTFISLMRNLIVFSLKTENKGRKRPFYKGPKFIMVTSEDFERALGREIPEEVLIKLRHKEEMVVHRFVDERYESIRASKGDEKRPIHSVYFPSDCRLYIFIPTENGSYWHQLDMQRASKIRVNGK